MEQTVSEQNVTCLLGVGEEGHLAFLSSGFVLVRFHPEVMEQTVSEQNVACLLGAVVKNIGEEGHRSLYLAHAKRALYHLSYIPM